MATSVPTSRPPSDGEPSRGPTLLDLLREEISAQISASTSELDSRDGPYLRIEGVLCGSLDDVRENGLSVDQNDQRLVLVRTAADLGWACLIVIANMKSRDISLSKMEN